MAIVYVHKKKETEQIFYVGIGKELQRAYQKKFRSDYWKSIVSKYGFDVEIIKQDISWEEACILEIELIAKYKRKCDGGFLCNITKGGDGVVGIKMTQEQKDKISNSNKGKTRSIETRLNISKGRTGIIFSDNHRKNISKAKMGFKCSDEFKKRRVELTTLGNHFKAIEVVDLMTGIFYSCIKEGCIATNSIYTTEVQRMKRNSIKARFSSVYQ
jgi:hypothetical protein